MSKPAGPSAGEEDVEYKRNVRTMSLVLAAIVLTIFAALFIPPYLNPQDTAQSRTSSVDSPLGFEMTLAINSTTVSRTGGVTITAWINSTSNQILNLTVANTWQGFEGQLVRPTCAQGWPFGIGVMRGHYTLEDFKKESLLPFRTPSQTCFAWVVPEYFLISPHGSRAIAVGANSSQTWGLQTSNPFSPGSADQPSFVPGTYTVVAEDEWGDVTFVYFTVS
ncbi:MAG: hypothetical protein HY247_08005 [archaeon]|nr:MAG: hypothetical protein HY247_08005 [archaeon]